ncbi:hypothetical protein [uncultured Halopseudomonas sp.]|uniref:hypothetical protein n=1 Tax=uncultured Halopseudomonas sp. TaxID=2901193 RepID=UPI0030EC90D5
MGEVIDINTSDTGTHRDDQGRHLDAYGQTLLLGILSDLCRQRDQEADPQRASTLDSFAKRLGKVLERYEPDQ